MSGQDCCTVEIYPRWRARLQIAAETRHGARPFKCCASAPSQRCWSAHSSRTPVVIGVREPSLSKRQPWRNRCCVFRPTSGAQSFVPHALVVPRPAPSPNTVQPVSCMRAGPQRYDWPRFCGPCLPCWVEVAMTRHLISPGSTARTTDRDLFQALRRELLGVRIICRFRRRRERRHRCSFGRTLHVRHTSHLLRLEFTVSLHAEHRRSEGSSFPVAVPGTPDEPVGEVFREQASAVGATWQVRILRHWWIQVPDLCRIQRPIARYATEPALPQHDPPSTEITSFSFLWNSSAVSRRETRDGPSARALRSER